MNSSEGPQALPQGRDTTPTNKSSRRPRSVSENEVVMRRRSRDSKALRERRRQRRISVKGLVGAAEAEYQSEWSQQQQDSLKDIVWTVAASYEDGFVTDGACSSRSSLSWTTEEACSGASSAVSSARGSVAFSSTSASPRNSMSGQDAVSLQRGEDAKADVESRPLSRYTNKNPLERIKAMGQFP